MRRVTVLVGSHVKTFGNPINARKIAKRKISVIPQIVLRTVVQHAAPNQESHQLNKTLFISGLKY